MKKKIIALIFAVCVLFSMCTIMVNAKESYIPIAEGVYNGHTYQIFDEDIKWTEAKEYCESIGGYLSCITSEDEQEFVVSLINTGEKNCYWLGGHRKENGGFEWINGGDFDYTNWDSGEPSNTPNKSPEKSEDYVSMYRIPDTAKGGSKAYTWNDAPNGGEINFYALRNFGFVCEWNNVSSSFGSEISEWASDEIEEAYSKELIPEILVGEDLTQPITRAEFAAVSVKTYETMANTKALPAINNPFTDTKDVEVLKAYNTGITTGISSTEFAPDELLNREQAATMLTRVFKRATMKNWTIETDSQFKLDYKKPVIFADDIRISEWAKDSVYFMVANEIINGVGDNKFAPQNTTTEEAAMGYANATREQALIIATRMVENLK
ncbi:MAG: S-layer homology domain-containing protein [Clostridia bacterium]|nr:S-layer homology domain-containing protein [Clostridia bacterium]